MTEDEMVGRHSQLDGHEFEQAPGFGDEQIGKKWKQWQILFSWTPKSLQVVSAVMKLKDTQSLEEKL